MLIIYILLLYECSANIFSMNNFHLCSNTFDHFNSNQFNSNHFNSHQFNSNHFNSHQFNSYQQTLSNHFNSHQQTLSNHFNSYQQRLSMPLYQKSLSLLHETLVSLLPKSYYIMVTSTPYISLIPEPTFAPYISPIATYMPSVAPTWRPTSTIETWAPTCRPTSTIVTQGPTSSPPTCRPTSTIETWGPTCRPTSTIETLAPTSSPPTCRPTSTIETCRPTSTIATLAPTSTIVTLAPTSSPPTCRPTSTIATFGPTSSPPDIPSISFTTDLTLSNVQTNSLDSLAQQSVVIATANSMNISVDFVTFVSSSVSKDQKYRDIRILSFNLVATTKTFIPLQGKYSTFISNPNSLFTALSTTMLAAVSSGSFTNYLITASMALNSTSTATASVISITISTPIGLTYEPTSGPTSGPTNTNTNNNYYNTFLYVFVSCITFGMLIYSIETIRNYKINRKLRDNRLIIEIEPINTENIELVIFNNN